MIKHEKHSDHITGFIINEPPKSHLQNQSRESPTEKSLTFAENVKMMFTLIKRAFYFKIPVHKSTGLLHINYSFSPGTVHNFKQAEHKHDLY